MFIYWSLSKFIRISILLCIMSITLIGNLYILIELTFRRQGPRKRLHVFIYHLAIGDLTICLCTMTSELFLLIYDQEWILGNVACKLTLYIQVVTIASTTFIHVAMTYDRSIFDFLRLINMLDLCFDFRYEAVYCPLRTSQSFFRIQRTIFICWLTSFLVAIPQLFIFEQSLISNQTNKYRCASTGYSAEWQRYVYFTVFSSYVLFIPIICMTIWFIRIIHTINLSTKIWNKNQHDAQTLTNLSCTSPTKIHTVKLAMTIIIVFLICWTPYIVITLIEIYSQGRVRIPSWLDGTLQMFCFCQSGLNPFIYLAFNRRRRYSSTLIRAVASTYWTKFDRTQRGLRRERGGSISRKEYCR